MATFKVTPSDWHFILKFMINYYHKKHVQANEDVGMDGKREILIN